MKVAYVFAMPRAASYKLGQMILPQLEAGTHGVEVVGMFFFDDNTFVLRKGDPIGERLSAQAQKTGMLLMMCDMCALERNLATGEPRWAPKPDGTDSAVVHTCETERSIVEGQPQGAQPLNTVDGVAVGCFPDLYAALAGNMPDQVITL